MLFRVDFKSGHPVYLQLAEQIKEAAASGALRPGESLPSISDVAAKLRIGRNTIAKAYSELENLGIIEMDASSAYILKEQHRPLRKNLSRIAPAPSSPGRKIPLRAKFVHRSASAMLAVIYLASIALIALLLIRMGFVQDASAAVVVTVALTALLLPLRNRLQNILERVLFRKRHAASRVLESLKARSWSQPDLSFLLQCAVESSETVIGVRPQLVSDRTEVLSLVQTFPALRSAREPLSVGNDLLMPLYSDEEVLAVLRLPNSSIGRGTWEDANFLVALAEQVAAVANRWRVRSERAESEYALEIQRALLPSSIPQLPGFSIAGAWQPAKNIGGDYYDVFPLGEDELVLIVADVAGKGMPAALLMASLQATTKAYAGLTSSSSELCERVNRAICGGITSGRFITFFYGVINARKRTFTYTNAGHNPPLIVSRDGTCRNLETGGAVLGIFADAAYQEEAIELVEGDRLVLFTDGVVEAEDPRGKEFGDDRLFTAVTASANASAADLRASIMQAVTQFCAGDFADDATLLTVVVDAAANVAVPEARAASAGG